MSVAKLKKAIHARQGKDLILHRNMLMNAIYNGDVLRASLALRKLRTVDFIFGEFPVIIHAIMQEQIEIVEMLLEKDADANTRDNGFDNSCMALAIKKGNIEIVRILIKYEALLNPPGEFRYIQYALSQDQTDIAKLLFKSGAKLSNVSADWSIHCSIKNGHLHHIDVFEEMGFSLQSYSSRVVGKIPSFMYEDSERFEVPSPLHSAVHSTKLEVLDHVVQKMGLDRRHIVSLLYDTWKQNKYFIYSSEIAEYIVNNGDIDKDVFSDHLSDRHKEIGLTILSIACYTENIPLVMALLKANVDVNEQDALGNTALHYVIQYGVTKLTGELLNSGADPDILNKEGISVRMQIKEKYDIELGDPSDPEEEKTTIARIEATHKKPSVFTSLMEIFRR